MRVKFDLRRVAWSLVVLTGLAQTYCLTAAELSPLVSQLFTQAQEAQKAGKLDIAIAGYRKVLVSAPQFAGAHFNLGLALEQIALPSEALQEFLLARKLEPTIPGVDLFIGIESYSTHNFADAEGALNRAVKSNPGDAQAWLWLGKTQSLLSKLPEATHALERARFLAPNDASVLYNLGQTYAKLSQKTYEALYAADPGSYLVDLVLAQSYTAQRNHPAAILKYKEIERKEPTVPGVHESIAAIYFADGDFQQAQDEFRQELKVDSNNTAALTGLGMILDRRRDSQQAAEYLRRSLRIDSASALAHLYLGRSLMHLGSLQQAVPELMEAARLDSSNAAVHYQLYQAYTQLNQSESAALEMQRFKQLGQAAKDRDQQKADEIRNREHLRQPGSESALETEPPATVTPTPAAPRPGSHL